MNGGLASSILNGTAVGPSDTNVPAQELPADDDDRYDMFADDDDEDTAARPTSEGNNLITPDAGAAGEGMCVITASNTPSLTNYFYFVDLLVIIFILSADLQMAIHRVIMCTMRLQGIVSLFSLSPATFYKVCFPKMSSHDSTGTSTAAGWGTILISVPGTTVMQPLGNGK